MTTDTATDLSLEWVVFSDEQDDEDEVCYRKSCNSEAVHKITYDKGCCYSNPMLYCLQCSEEIQVFGRARCRPCWDTNRTTLYVVSVQPIRRCL